jgi:two-component SAPR family response regulator
MRPEFCELVLSSLEEQGTAAGELVQFFRATPEFAQRAARISEGAPAPMVLKIYSLGISQVQVGEEWIADSSWKTQKVKSVFFYLAAQDGRAVVVDNLLEEFWPESGEAARANLNTAASSIRRTLRSAREVAGPDPILRVRESICINPDCPRWHDVEELEKAYQAGCRAWEEGQLDVGVLQFTRVAQLYRGPYLDGIYMDWALRRRTSIERIVGEALERLADSCLDQKSYKEALEYSQRLLEIRPESVDAHHAKMRAHLGLEEHSLVAQQFEACRKMMEEMYSTPPPTELLKTLYQSRYGLTEPSAKI